MHPNPAFRTNDRDTNLAFARERGFGMLAIQYSGVPILSHVPFVVTPDDKQVELHLVRSNPIVQALKQPCSASIAVTGPDAYVSPDWYGVPDQVPTWNYVAVHLEGRLELRPQSELRDLLDRQAEVFEGRLSPKKPWTTGKMDADTLNRMQRMIVPCRFYITDIHGTWKLNQNKSETARLGAANGLATSNLGSEIDLLSQLMKQQT